MDKGKTNTKSRILEVALNLFSQKQYNLKRIFPQAFSHILTLHPNAAIMGPD